MCTSKIKYKYGPFMNIVQQIKYFCIKKHQDTVEPHLSRLHLSRIFNYLDTYFGTNLNLNYKVIFSRNSQRDK